MCLSIIASIENVSDNSQCDDNSSETTPNVTNTITVYFAKDDKGQRMHELNNERDKKLCVFRVPHRCVKKIYWLYLIPNCCCRFTF